MGSLSRKQLLTVLLKWLDQSQAEHYFLLLFFSMLEICSAFIVFGHWSELAFELGFVYLVLIYIFESIRWFLEWRDIFHVEIANLLELLPILLPVLFLEPDQISETALNLSPSVSCPFQ